MASKSVTSRVSVKGNLKLAPLSSLEDNDLIERFRKGCEASYEEIVKRYQTKVYNLAMRFTKNIEDTEEVIQDVFVTVYRKIDGFKGESKFSSWLYRITVNAAFMKLRKKKQEQSMPLEDMLPHIQNKAVEHKNSYTAFSDFLVLNNEVKEMLESAIAKLPDEYRAVFILRDIDGLSNKEVCEVLNLSVPAVKSRLHRSRIMLRRKLRKFYNDYTSDDKDLGTGVQRIRAAA